MQEAFEPLFQTMASAVAALLAGLLYGALRWFLARARKEEGAFASADLSAIVEDAVAEAEQTLVTPLKREAKQPDSVAVRSRVCATVRRNLGPRGLARLRRSTGLRDQDLDRRIDTQIEAAVHALRSR